MHVNYPNKQTGGSCDRCGVAVTRDGRTCLPGSRQDCHSPRAKVEQPGAPLWLDPTSLYPLPPPEMGWWWLELPA